MTDKSDLLRVWFDLIFEFPALRIMPKSGSWFMRALAIILWPVNRTFMVDYVTVIGNYCWFPSDWDNWPEEKRASILRHERVHLRQQRRYGLVLYCLLYLVGLRWDTWTWRAYFEMEAYAESIRARAEYYGVETVDTSYQEFVFGQFTGPGYVWMCPFRRVLRRWWNDVGIGPAAYAWSLPRDPLPPPPPPIARPKDRQ